MDIVKKLISKEKYSIKCPYTLSPIGITVHNTANSASAANEIAYMAGNDKEISYHFAVDEKEIIQALPLDRNGWHAGDGATGSGNRRTIAIEICRSTSDDLNLFIQAEKNAAWLCASLCLQYGWSTKDIYTHKHWSGKNCPHKTLELGWDRFLAMVEQNMTEMRKQEKKGDFANMTADQKKSYVKGLYVTYTGRQADPSGLKYWIDQIGDQTALIDIEKAFANQEECRKYAVKNAYRNVMKREADSAGLKYWTDWLKKHTAAELYDQFVALKKNGQK
ncbi:MAG: N-acetylmuramoyl-L-alanine amidase [Agathobacter sp.]|nr:N-acetylmuramoyl-L-alanine amidase [Agathobacter sp.]